MRLLREVAEFYDSGPIQIIAMPFAIICSLDKFVSALCKTFDKLVNISKLERSIDCFAPASLALDCETEKQQRIGVGLNNRRL